MLVVMFMLVVVAVATLMVDGSGDKIVMVVI